jgi:hypothetical protein
VRSTERSEIPIELVDAPDEVVKAFDTIAEASE